MNYTPEGSEGKRIVSVYEEFFCGGARILHTDVLLGLQERGWDNTVLTISDRTLRETTLQFMENDASYQKLRAAGIEIVSLGRHALNGPDPSPFTRDEINVALETSYGADAILSLKEHPVRLLNQARGLGATAIACLHRSDPENQGGALDELRIAMQDGIVDLATTSAYSSKTAYAEAGLPEQAIEVITNGIDLDRFRPSELLRAQTRRELGIGDDNPVVMFVARFDTMKNVPLFIESAGQYLADDPMAHVIVCGGGMTSDNDNLMQIIREYYKNDDSTARTHLLGIQHSMEAIYPAADVIALTSKFGETYPLCLLEGMACGAVPVATRVGDTQDMLKAGRGIITPFDSDAIVDAWRSAITYKDAYQLSPEERQDLGRDAMINRYEHIFSQAIMASAQEDQVAV